MKNLGLVSSALLFDDLPIGTIWRSTARTLLECDLASYVNLTWFTEELFTNLEDRVDNAISGRPVPALMVMAFAEGLVVRTIERTGLAFLHNVMNVLKPSRVGDTIHVECEVIESRLTSAGDRGLVRTRNTVVNQNGEIVLVYEPLRLMRRGDAN